MSAGPSPSPPSEGPAYRAAPTYLPRGGPDPDPDGPSRGARCPPRSDPGRLLVTGVLLDALRAVFRRADDAADQRLRDLRWDPDDAATRILILTNGRLDLAAVDHTPRLVVAPGDWSAPPLGIGHDEAFGAGSQRRHVGLDVGEHRVIALADDQDVAELVARQAYVWLRALQPVIAGRLLPPGSRFRVAGLGAPGRVDGARLIHAVPIRATYALPSAWRLATDDPTFAGVVAELSGR